MTLYAIAKATTPKKTIVRYGLNGGGEIGYCLNRGHIACFDSFEDANEALATFTDPFAYDIVKLTNDQDRKLANIRNIIMSNELCADAMVTMIGDIVSGDWEEIDKITITFDRHFANNPKPKVFECAELARDWIMDGIYGTEGAEQEHYVSMLCQLEEGKTTLVY